MQNLNQQVSWSAVDLRTAERERREAAGAKELEVLGKGSFILETVFSLSFMFMLQHRPDISKIVNFLHFMAVHKLYILKLV